MTVVILFLFSGCILSGSDDDEPAITIQGNTYKNSTIGFEITAPDGWSIDTATAGVLVEIWIAKPEFAPNLNVVISAKQQQWAYDCPTLGAFVEEQLRNDVNWQTITVGAAQDVGIDLVKACAIPYEGTYAGIAYPLKGRQIMWPHRDYIYAMSIIDRSINYDSSSTYFDSIIESIQLF